ncbi:hypothetical protein LLG07_00965 [bacterium]|nr:hypothetical protein [bacterium]
MFIKNKIKIMTAGKVSGGQAAYGFIFSEELTARNLNNDEFLAVMYEAFFD